LRRRRGRGGKMYNKILVTGGCGYIASQLIRDLPEKYPDAEIVLFDKKFIPHVLAGLDKGHYTFVQGDILDTSKLKSVCNSVDCCFHLAAEVSAETSLGRGGSVWDINYNGTLNVIDALPDGCRFIFPSTTNLYGKTDKTDLKETENLYPIYPYANSKATVEKVLKDTNLDWTIARIATNYGWAPGIRFNLVVNLFVYHALTRGGVKIYGTGKQWRPFIHVKDTSRGLIKLSEPEHIGKVYNLGGENITVEDLAQLVVDNAPINIKLSKIEDVNTPFSYNVNFDKIESIGFKRKWDLIKGVKDLFTKLEGLL